MQVKLILITAVDFSKTLDKRQRWLLYVKAGENSIAVGILLREEMQWYISFKASSK